MFRFWLQVFAVTRIWKSWERASSIILTFFSQKHFSEIFCFDSILKQVPDLYMAAKYDSDSSSNSSNPSSYSLFIVYYYWDPQANTATRKLIGVSMTTRFPCSKGQFSKRFI